MIYQGSNARMSYTSRTYKPGAISPYNGWHSLGGILSDARPISRSARAEAKAFVLTSTPNTPSAASPATATAALAILAPGNQNELMFDPKPRNVPITLVLLPYESASGTLTLLTTT